MKLSSKASNQNKPLMPLIGHPTQFIIRIILITLFLSLFSSKRAWKKSEQIVPWDKILTLVGLSRMSTCPNNKITWIGINLTKIQHPLWNPLKKSKKNSLHPKCKREVNYNLNRKNNKIKFQRKISFQINIYVDRSTVAQMAEQVTWDQYPPTYN